MVRFLIFAFGFVWKLLKLFDLKGGRKLWLPGDHLRFVPGAVLVPKWLMKRIKRSLGMVKDVVADIIKLNKTND